MGRKVSKGVIYGCVDVMEGGKECSSTPTYIDIYIHIHRYIHTYT